MPETTASSSPPRVRLPPPGVALKLLGESLAHRSELLALEFGEAREHATISGLLAVGAGVLALVTGFAFTLFIASLVWDQPNREWWLAGLCGVYLAATVITGIVLARRLRQWRPLGETQAQLQQDYQCLNHLLKSAIQ